MQEKVYQNIYESEYKIVKSGLIFYFSSNFYMKKFVEKVDKYVEEESLKLKNRYNINISFTLFFIISLYKKIEKRGFCVYDDINKKYLKENIIILSSIY